MAKPGGKGKTNEEIFATFQKLRGDQRLLANKLSELGMDLNEHKIVIETLRGVEAGRKCYRMVGGVLAERTVAEVLPALEGTAAQLPRAMRALEEQLANKGQEINAYIQQHDIRVQRIDKAGGGGGGGAGDPSLDAAGEQAAKPNVLVASS